MSAGTPAKSTRLTCADLNGPRPLPTIDTVAPGTPVCGCNSIFGGAAPAGPLPTQASIRLVIKAMIQFIRKSDLKHQSTLSWNYTQKTLRGTRTPRTSFRKENTPGCSVKRGTTDYNKRFFQVSSR